MALTVNTNIPSLTAQRNLGNSNDMLAKSLERLSSGLRVNRSADDAAGLSIATKLNMQSRGLRVAVRNAGDAGSLVNTAEGAFNVATNIIGRLRELAVQAASDTNTAQDRATLGGESKLLVAELNRLASTTEFNGSSLLDGSFSSGKIQVGANADQTISFSLGDVRAAQLGKFAAFSVDIDNGIGSAGGSQQSGYGNITAGEFNINGQLVGATAGTDDQVSVLELFYNSTGGTLRLGDGTVGASGATASMGTSATTGNIANQLASGVGALYINGTAITSLATVDGLSAASGTSSPYSTNSQFVSAFVAKINAAGITNVTARQNADGSTYALVAAKGTDIKLAYSNTANVSMGSQFSSIGLASQVVGSGNATSEVSTYNGQSGAISKAAAINNVRGKTGVAAVAVPNVFSQLTGVVAGTLSANALFINGFAIDATTNILAGDSTGVLRAAINAKTASTGVTASVSTGGALILTAADGRNISAFVGTSEAATVTAASQGVNMYRGAVRMTSQSDVSFTGRTTDIGSASTGVPYTTDLENSLAVMDIGTQAGANTAIMSLDAALAQISKVRSDVGALQARLDLTTQALNVSAENQEAAAARIKDADFAYETAQFTRNQILVQAGTAILSQANSTSQIALQLLK
ncbi:MAG: flagellin [Nitrospirota bacterium]|nr:flagellin [Nitrospirota bacterium]MDP2383783.1 flagellin [Nitrospirota bacterium]MDP3596386.1 flagellin [Nitrospirota bacterium]